MSKQQVKQIKYVIYIIKKKINKRCKQKMQIIQLQYIIMCKISFELSKIILIIFVILCLSQSIKVDPDTTLFVDQYGRYTVFHGVNVVQKLFPFYPKKLDHFDANYSLADMDLQNLRGWGFNHIRLHVAWEGVEPKRNQYNYTYIQKLRQIVQKCNKYGIYVLLDAHQDLYNRQFCGQGFPDWAVQRTNFPFPLPINMDYDEHGNPNRTKCLSMDFGVFYLSQDVMRLQQDFFTNQRGILDSFTKMWQRVAAYIGKQPNLLGYQLINQPIGSNVYRSIPDVIMPGWTNNKFLLPGYTKIYEGIRKYDESNLIFYQPSTTDILGAGFYETIGGQKQKQKQVFSYHVYCPYVTSLGQPKSDRVCYDFDQLTIASKQQNAKKMRVGAFMTQFGALSNSIKSAAEITRLADELNKYFRSWTYWQFKYFDDITTAAMPGTTQSFYDVDGHLQQNKVKALARPYAYAICGKPIQQLFKKGIYTLNWIPNKDCFNKNTQIFLSTSFYFPAGFDATFKNCQKCYLKPMSVTGYYQVILDRMHRTAVKLTVKAKTNNNIENIVNL